MISTLALISSDGDSFELSILPLTERKVEIISILRYEGNQNVEPEHVRFLDLPHGARENILSQIHRKYPGVTVIV